VPVVVVATIVPLAEHRAEVVAAFKQAIPVVHGEDGCILYAMHEADERLVMVEQWQSQDALDRHAKGEALRRLGGALAGKVAGPPEVITLTAVPAGDLDKGQLRP
jgi:quinol monooxygenase YgiN